MRSVYLSLLLMLLPGPLLAFEVDHWPGGEFGGQPVRQQWPEPAAATKPLTLCALYPHLRDAYWLSVNQGMVEEATRLGVSLRIHEAGGYGALAEQRQQLQQCLREGSDAILLGAVSHEGLREAITASPLPVFGLVNDLPAGLVRAKVGVSWYQMGWQMGHWLALRHPAGSQPVSVALFPGPKSSGGNNVVEPGFADAIRGSAIKLVTTARGDNSREIQRTLVQQTLARHPDLDYLVGGAIAAEVAVNELAQRHLDRPQVLSTYFSHGVQRGLLRGKMLAANSDQMRLQGRLAVAQAVCLLQHPEAGEQQCPRVMGPPILTLDGPLADTGDSLSDGAFRPVYRVGAAPADH
ncbi:TMAO reductase system periplasmic protein TorT [Aeromonas rivipollensis]|uniref:TMAO reductase system periplasmic protein TorT n=1 Tax=Aeromonas rivipollensis TaxID=948519 RepID=UPI00259E403D|nr:TMAO reductase system periplasmic protein TorT [Aeromonas rivipollensis]MDM5059802.1 TMAO reductase system periplasmic protein TorT [Aeromonas rivipollensis]